MPDNPYSTQAQLRDATRARLQAGPANPLMETAYGNAYGTRYGQLGQAIGAPSYGQLTPAYRQYAQMGPQAAVLRAPGGVPPAPPLVPPPPISAPSGAAPAPTNVPIHPLAPVAGGKNTRAPRRFVGPRGKGVGAPVQSFRPTPPSPGTSY